VPQRPARGRLHLRRQQRRIPRSRRVPRYIGGRSAPARAADFTRWTRRKPDHAVTGEPGPAPPAPRAPSRRSKMSPNSTDAMKSNLGEAGAHLKNAASDAGSAIKNAAGVAGDELRMGRAAVKADLADSALAGIAALEEGG